MYVYFAKYIFYCTPYVYVLGNNHLEKLNLEAHTFFCFYFFFSLDSCRKKFIYLRHFVYIILYLKQTFECSGCTSKRDVIPEKAYIYLAFHRAVLYFCVTYK